MENRRERRTGHHVLSPFVRATSSVTARCSVRGVARTGGVMYWIRSCPATGRQECDGTFAPTPHSPSRTSMSTWRSGESSTQYGAEQQGAAIRDRSTGDLWGGRRSVQAYTTTSGIVQGVGTVLGGWWPRWSGIGESCSLGWASSSPTAGPEGVVRFYNGRGTAEQWIKEGKYALNCSAVVPSVRGQPGASVSVHSGVQPWELPSPLCLPKAIRHWSLRSVRSS